MQEASGSEAAGVFPSTAAATPPPPAPSAGGAPGALTGAPVTPPSNLAAPPNHAGAAQGAVEAGLANMLQSIEARLLATLEERLAQFGESLAKAESSSSTTSSRALAHPLDVDPGDEAAQVYPPTWEGCAFARYRPLELGGQKPQEFRVDELARSMGIKEKTQAFHMHQTDICLLTYLHDSHEELRRGAEPGIEDVYKLLGSGDVEQAATTLEAVAYSVRATRNAIRELHAMVNFQVQNLQIKYMLPDNLALHEYLHRAQKGMLEGAILGDPRFAATIKDFHEKAQAQQLKAAAVSQSKTTSGSAFAAGAKARESEGSGYGGGRTAGRGGRGKERK